MYTKQESILISYCAGIIDGEGSIGTEVARTGFGRKNPSYRVRVRVIMCDREAIDVFINIFGGSIKERYPKNITHRKTYDWCARNIEALKVLQILLPYLKIKNKQALVGIELAKDVSQSLRFKHKGHKGFNQTTPETLKYRNSLYLKLKKLNARGTKNNLG